METNILEQIKYLRDNQKLSFRQIGEILGLGRTIVLRAYYGKSRVMIRKRKSLKLDKYYSLIVEWFNEYPNLKARQIWERLKERGVIVNECTVSRYTKKFRKKKSKIYFPLEFLPGEEAQVDWFFENHSILGKLCGFAMVLSYSRTVFVCFFPRHSFEFFIEGHLKAFEYFKGLPRGLRYDNLKSVVLKRQPLTYNSSFVEFARYYNFSILLCNIAAGNEKGRVERIVRTVRDNFLNIASNYSTLQTLNQATFEWIEKKNSTKHRVTGELPFELLKKENLKPLPNNSYRNEIILPFKKATKTGFITFDNNLYSIPDYLIHELFTIHSSVSNIRIYNNKGKIVANHLRTFKKNQTIFNPVHRSFKQLSQEAKRERIYSVIRNLDPIIKIFLEYNHHAGEDPYTTAYLIFKLLPGHARETVLSAIRNLVSQKKYSVQILYKLLQRIPDSEPVFPKNLTLLDIDYKPRSLDEYQP